MRENMCISLIKRRAIVRFNANKDKLALNHQQYLIIKDMAKEIYNDMKASTVSISRYNATLRCNARMGNLLNQKSHDLKVCREKLNIFYKNHPVFKPTLQNI